MRIVTLIPARSGSKGLPNKNILNLLGIPMFAWSIIHAQYYSKKDDLIIVSSDSEEYLEIAERFNAVPFLRSKNLSKDILSRKFFVQKYFCSKIYYNITIHNQRLYSFERVKTSLKQLGFDFLLISLVFAT